jgi:transcriptional regulatory protein LevR
VGPTGPRFPVVFARLMREAIPPLLSYAFTSFVETTALSNDNNNNNKVRKNIRVIVKEIAGESCGSSVCILNGDHITNFLEKYFTS